MLKYESLLFNEMPGAKLFSSVRPQGTVFVRENNINSDGLRRLMCNVTPANVEQAKMICWHEVRDMVYQRSEI